MRKWVARAQLRVLWHGQFRRGVGGCAIHGYSPPLHPCPPALHKAIR
jgi:hypothetical protein